MVCKQYSNGQSTRQKCLSRICSVAQQGCPCRVRGFPCCGAPLVAKVTERVAVILKRKPLPGEEGLRGCLPGPFMIYS